MGRLRRTWELAKASWDVLRHDRELLLLPLLSFLASAIIMATFLVPLFVLGGGDPGGDAGPVEYALLAVLYIVLSTVTVYFQTALVAAANDRLTGGDPSLGSAVRAANGHLPQVLGWGVLAGTVSLVLKILEQRLDVVGRLVIAIVGVAWSLATFLVIPTYVVEHTGSIEAVKRSGSMLRQTWGENLAAQVGFGLLGAIAGLLAFPIVLASVWAGIALGPVVLVIGIAIALLWVAGVAVVVSALNAIFQTALFHYATTGDVPGTDFAPQQLAGAFAPR